MYSIYKSSSFSKLSLLYIIIIMHAAIYFIIIHNYYKYITIAANLLNNIIFCSVEAGLRKALAKNQTM